MTVPLQIVHTNDIDECRRLRDQGYCPIECSFGVLGNVVDELEMDHHGEYSRLPDGTPREGVAVRSYRDKFGARRDDPRFVITGRADGDMTWSIASLAAFLPHPSRDQEFQSAPPGVRAAMTTDLIVLAELINRVNGDPIGVLLGETNEGLLLLLWVQMSSPQADALSAYGGVDRWRRLTTGRQPTPLIRATREEEEKRVTLVRQAPVERISDKVIVVRSAEWGYDIWYREQNAEVVVLLTPDATDNISVGCPNEEVAERLFGKGGLRNVFPSLAPAGWGGRESIGGGPRGVGLTYEQAVEAARVIASLIKK